MSKAEDLSRQYVLPFLDKRYKNYGEHKQMEKSRFDGYDMMSAYEEGYHQAEKDLDVVSWVKEVSGVKELSRAEEEALKAYPPQSIAANYDTINRRDAFEYGYLKAEKDLELTWEDMRELHIIFTDIDVDIELCKTGIKSDTLGYYQEVLKRFNKARKEK